jgi:hypothetical protein
MNNVNPQTTTKGLLLDGFAGGMAVADARRQEMSISLSDSQFQALRAAFARVGYSEEGKNLYTQVRLEGSLARLQLRVENERKFFNCSGNPISFLTGQNVGGSLNVSQQVREFYDGVAHALNLEWEPVTASAIQRLDIHVHSLAFAAYTQDLGFKRRATLERLINAWCMVYSTGTLEGGRMLSDILGVKVSKEGPLSLRLEKRQGRHKYWTLCVYNKNQELEDADLETVPSLESRFRLDLTIHRRWFDANRCPTLGTLHTKYGSAWTSFVTKMFRRAIDDLKLIYVFTCVNPYTVDVGNYGRDFKRWEARESVSEEALKWYDSQGLDLRLEPEFYWLALAAHARMNTGREHLRNWLKHQDVSGLVKGYTETADARKLRSLSPRLLPDFSLKF